MKPTIVPIICGAALAVMLTAGFGEWLTVRHFVAGVRAGVLVSPAAETPLQPDNSTKAETHQALVAQANLLQRDGVEPSQKQFYEGLIKKINTLEKQARDLEGQMGETNRDVMSLGFRVDTHSTQFRPLPVTEELRSLKYADEAVNGLDIDDGVLPPRAEPVFLLPEESSTQ